MTQQNWPFENGIDGVTSGEELNSAEDDADDQDVSDANVIYIVEGDQLCYGSKRAWYLIPIVSVWMVAGESPKSLPVGEPAPRTRLYRRLR